MSGIVLGLGQVSGPMVGVSFAVRNALLLNVEAVAETPMAPGLGIEEADALSLRTVSSSGFWVTASLRLN